MSLTQNSNQLFLPGGCNRNSKFEIWPLDQMDKFTHLSKRLSGKLSFKIINVCKTEDFWERLTEILHICCI